MPETVALNQERGRAGGWVARNWALLFLLARARRLHGAGLAVLLPGEPPEHPRRLHAGSCCWGSARPSSSSPAGSTCPSASSWASARSSAPSSSSCCRRPAFRCPRPSPSGALICLAIGLVPGFVNGHAGGPAQGAAVPRHLRHLRHRLRRRRDHLRTTRPIVSARGTGWVGNEYFFYIVPGKLFSFLSRPQNLSRLELRSMITLIPIITVIAFVDRGHLRLRAAAHALRQAHLRDRRERGRRHPGGHQRAAPPHLRLHDLLVLRGARGDHVRAART